MYPVQANFHTRTVVQRHTHTHTFSLFRPALVVKELERQSTKSRHTPSTTDAATRMKRSRGYVPRLLHNLGCLPLLLLLRKVVACTTKRL